MRGHKEGLSAVAYSPDGKRVASGGQDTAIRLWDTETGRQVRRLETEDGYVWALAFTPDGKTIIGGGGRLRRTVHIWDAASGRELRSFKLPDGIMLRMAISPDGKWLATRRYAENEIRLWDVAAGKQIHQLAAPAARPATLEFSPDGKTLAAGCDYGIVCLWDVASGQTRLKLTTPLEPFTSGPIDFIAILPLPSRSDRLTA